MMAVGLQSKAKYQHGFSLTEILMGVFLSSVIITGLLSSYIRAKKQYNQLQVNIDNTLDREYITTMIRQRIQSAGFTPCINLNALMVVNHINTEEGVQSIRITPSPSPTLLIQRMSPYFVAGEVNNPGRVVISHNQAKFRKEDSVIVADCHHAEILKIFSIKRLHGKVNISLNDTLTYRYSGMVYVGKWLDESFFVTKSRLNYRLTRAEALSEEKVTDFKIHQLGDKHYEVLLKFKHDETYTKIRSTVRT